MSKIDRIKELVELLNHYRNEYYNNSRSEISDFEYDQLFDELSKLESETGFIMAVSPTQTVGYEVVSELDKVEHNHPMLSLKKTKEVEEVISFANGKRLICMLKLDGLTCSLRYVDGKLVSAETRGNGVVGENILHNAYHVKGIPHKIDFMGELIVDGEVICTTNDFKPWSDTYKNPRNFASGSIRLLDAQECAKRNLTFVAWDVIKGFEHIEQLNIKLKTLKKYNFITVHYNTIVTKYKRVVEEVIELIKGYAAEDGYPIDGVVFKFDDCKYYKSLGATDHHFRGGLAFKFYDETYPSTIIDIEWTMGRTGVLTPVAVFEPIDIDGSTVERASLHNLSIMEETIGIPYYGQHVEVFKANMIIPQIASANKVDGSDKTIIHLPEVCPICGSPIKIENSNSTKNLMCPNPECSAKKIAQFTHFVSRKCMNIDGMSEKTLEALLSHGFIHNFKDIYHLSKHYNALICLDGFGQKSIDNLLKSIEDSRNVKLENFIAALGIPNIGLSAAKTISQHFNGNYKELINTYFYWRFDWTNLKDFGVVMANSINSYLYEHFDEINELADEMHFVLTEEYSISENPFNGKSICVTGKLNHFTRDSINEKIVSLGAKFASSVSKKTDYLITNESSGSSKYKKAIELNIPIITEEEFLNMIGA